MQYVVVRLLAAGFAVLLPLASLAAGASLPRRATLGAGVTDAPNGVAVTAVVPGSAAEEAGIRVKDVVTAIDGAHVAGTAAFVAAIRHEPAGKTIALSLLRDGRPLTLNPKLKPAAQEHDAGLRTSYESLPFEGTLRRTLVTVPDSSTGRLPAVLLIGGIGCFTIDNAADTEDGYMRAMHDVARAGFLTMRLEKSGVGDSQGPSCPEVDFETESRSYAAALDALAHDPRVDPAHIYVLGHSIGTLIAPRLAEQRHIAGIVFSDGVGRDWFEYEMINLRRQLELGGEAPEAVDATMLSKARCMEHLLYEGVPRDQLERNDPACAKHDAVYPVAAAYMQQVAAVDVVAPWVRLDVPVLLVYGGSDYVVDPADHRRIAEIVNAHHPGRATLHVVDGMDHPLHAAATAAVAMQDAEKGVVERYAPQFSETVVTWLCGRERCRR